MSHKRNDGGFTMMEMLIAVGILVILMGVGFVAVQSYQRTMKQKELDEIAKEIFVAAQNHLSVADSQGILQQRSVNDKAGESGASYARGDTHYNYYFVNSDIIESRDIFTGTVLGDMLPPFSIDDTVRKGGSYVIEYDLESATVINVFYCEGTRGLSDHRFTPSDFGALFVSPGYVGSDKSDERLNAESFGGSVIGWYGGDDAKGLSRIRLNAPTIKLENKERLEAKVSLSMRYITRMMGYTDADPYLTVYVKSKDRSDVEPCVATKASGRATDLVQVNDGKLTIAQLSVVGEAERVGSDSYRTITFVLDDITTSDASFYKQFCSGTGGELIPGEDIVVWAEVTSNKVLSNIATSNKLSENSLFAKSTIDSTTNKVTNQIANIRHLENLDGDISGYKPADVVNAGEKARAIPSNVLVEAKQIERLQWAGTGANGSTAFLDRIATKRGAKTATQRVDMAKGIQVHKLDGTSTKGGTYAPINPDYELSYEGVMESDLEVSPATNAIPPNSISNVQIDVETGDAGIFGNPKSVTSIKNLELLNFKVKTAAGSAGALAGTLTNTSVTGVLVRNVKTVKNASGTGTAVEPDGSSDYKIEGTTAAGGLVGMLTGNSNTESVSVENCAAATLVSSSAQDAATGGLIGAVSNNASIVGSYAGGHTNGSGVYDSTVFNVAASGANSVSGGLVGRVNTSGAGGGNVTIESCYATASASGKSFAGGLVGNATNAAISNCYCTGLVDATATGAGAFAGTLTNVQLGKSNDTGTNYFLEMVNQDSSLVPVGGQDPSEIKESQLAAADKNLETYTAFSVFTEPAVPYDATLTKNYGGKYTYKTTNLLKSSPEVFDEKDQSLKKTIATTHYGDWPSLETLVVNEK